jgi:N-dimethylarginine dimethylaminohydrolase
VIYYPNAFTAEGRAEIRRRVPAEKRIEIKFDDACLLAANAVCIDDSVMLSRCSDALRAAIERHNYRVISTPLNAFLRSGGSAFCLTLRLDVRSAKARAVKVAAA